jgi:VanZ family protein
MRSLHFRRLWIGLSLLLLAVSLWYFLKPLPDDFADWFHVPYKDKALHVFAFASLTGWFASLLEQRRWAQLCFCLLLYGILIEMAQSQMAIGRSADAIDVAADSLGVLVGVVLAAWFGARWLLGIDGWLRRWST